MAIRVKYRLTMIRKKYAKGMTRALRTAIYRGFSDWNRTVYQRIISTAPKSKTANPRWPIGFVSSHIKLVTLRTRGGYHYEVVSVPGKSSRRSRAWRAWLAIMSLHEGFKKLPFTRRPTRKRAMAFPIMPGTSIVRSKVIQRKQITLNPWIQRAFDAFEPQFRWMLRAALDSEAKRTKTEKRVYK